MSCHQVNEWVSEQASNCDLEIQIQILIWYSQQSNLCNISVAIVKCENVIHCESNEVRKDGQRMAQYHKLITVFFVTKL